MSIFAEHDSFSHPSGPPCFDSREQYHSWRASARDYSKGKTRPMAHFCMDCTPEYKEKMTNAARCVHPIVVFVQLPGEGLVGARPGEKHYPPLG